jgi:hypothetical protein
MKHLIDNEELNHKSASPSIYSRWARLFFHTFILLLLGFSYVSGMALALPSDASGGDTPEPPPIVIIIVDKLNSTELFGTDLPGIKRFLASSACGLLNIRSSRGYTDSASGYLTLGAGSRANAAVRSGASYDMRRFPAKSRSSAYIDWSTGIPLTVRSTNNMAVPGVGWVLNQALLEDHPVIPGRLGTAFQNAGWRTCLIGNIDTQESENRPGALFLMNRNGFIDEGNTGESLNESDPHFPYLYRANVTKIITELQAFLAERKIIAVDFGDFARLDAYREQMNPDRYIQVKQHAFERLSLLLEQILQLNTAKQFTTVLVSPSISKEGATAKNLLAPIVVNGPDYRSGLLVSGTTRWPGLVANIDLLPTLVRIAHLSGANPFAGKTMTCIPQPENIAAIQRLSQHLIAFNTNQRPILNWYQGLISCCWIAGWLVSIYLKKQRVADWLISAVAVIPLTLIIMPLMPVLLWQVPGFLALNLVLTAFFNRFKNIDTRILILSASIWLILIGDQILGWHLIRFSALGYSAMAGSRYYGLGNEFLGVFLAAALLFTHLLNKKTAYKWPVPIILGLTIFILSWPQFGAKFGGILAGSAGFAFYLMNLYNWKLNNGKLWITLVGCGLVLFAIGWWDSMRPPSVQTHIGKFLHLLISKDFGQVGQIIARKIVMNLKLSVFSPWSRISLLAIIIGIANHLVTAKNMIQPEDKPVWQAIIVAGITAYLVNDAGVLAIATCLAYAFSFVLLKNRATIVHSH